MRAVGECMRDFIRTLAPEQFDAKIEIHADGSYVYLYDGVRLRARAYTS